VDFEAIRKGRLLQAAGKLSQAIDLLSAALKTETSQERRAIIAFFIGELAIELKRWPEARDHFQIALNERTRLEDYALYSLGIAHLELKDLPAARTQFERVLQSRATGPLQLEARNQLAMIAIEQKQWRQAKDHLSTLQKRRRYSQAYPEVLYQLIRVERALGRRDLMCRWARELFSKYPAHPSVSNWTMELSQAQVDGKAIGCNVLVKDKQDRIKRLQWAGEADRALKELNLLREQAPWLGSLTFDTLMANHLIHEGSTEDALKLLLTHYDERSKDVGYLLQLGRAAARAGEHAAAVGSFYRAYQLAPRGRTGRQALFQAAFISYQAQDYDGASRKFEEFQNVFSRSGLSRDSLWHMAWIKYLRGDYSGAYRSLSELTKNPPRSRRGRRAVRESAGADRVRYWMAMALVKMGRAAEARPMFAVLAKDQGLGYYSIVAKYRLAELEKQLGPESKPEKKLDRAASRRLAQKGFDLKSLEKNEAAALVENANAVPVESAPPDEEAESEEAISDETAETGEGEATEGEEADTLSDDVRSLGAGFAEPNLSWRFERARQLAAVSREDWARQELIEIERSTRSASRLRQLMTEYQAVQSYHRASYLGEISFAGERQRGGVKNARELWEYAYPRAFERTVLSQARAFSVSPDFVWAIMRAESQYRQDAQSPVGALGLMQMMPFTGRRVSELLGMNSFQVRQLLDPDTNIRFGTRYLQRLLNKFSESIPLAAAAYNAGPHRAQSWLKSFGKLDMDEFIEHIPFIETRNYVKKVTRNYYVYQLLYNKKPPTDALSWLVQPVGVRPPENLRDVW